MTWLSERQDVPVGTVSDMDTGGPRTILRDWDTIVLPAMRLDAVNVAVLRQVLFNEAPALERVHAEMDQDEAERAALTGTEG
jgi:hypothetical protein